ncbi:MAG: YkgJ family cysteine cluster protein [Candidatus Krumholzibacteriia bacterium]
MIKARPTTRRQPARRRRATRSRVVQHPQCAQCLPARCCRYFSLEIDTPRSKRDYDDLLWMLAHGQVSVYVDERRWYLMIHTQCEFLDTDTNLCKIYERRPQMCREHSVDDCEWHGPYEFEEHFKSYDALKRWMRKRDM